VDMLPAATSCLFCLGFSKFEIRFVLTVSRSDLSQAARSKMTSRYITEQARDSPISCDFLACCNCVSEEAARFSGILNITAAAIQFVLLEII
jgi:hypothetical protein